VFVFDQCLYFLASANGQDQTKFHNSNYTHPIFQQLDEYQQEQLNHDKQYFHLHQHHLNRVFLKNISHCLLEIDRLVDPVNYVIRTFFHKISMYIDGMVRQVHRSSL